MDCPYCGSKNLKVTDSRDSKDGTEIKRRRECLDCHKRFTTAEKILKLDLDVKKNDGTFETFNISKIRKGLIKSCDKRPITLEEIDNLIERIILDLKKINGNLNTTLIGKIVLKHLKDLDDIAFLKFAIVHNKYKNIKEFVSEINLLKNFKGIDYK